MRESIAKGKARQQATEARSERSNFHLYTESKERELEVG